MTNSYCFPRLTEAIRWISDGATDDERDANGRALREALPRFFYEEQPQPPAFPDELMAAYLGKSR